VPERLFRLLVRLGDIYDAEKMIPVGSVQVAGVSYKSVGDPGLAFLEDMSSKGAKVKVLTYLNPAGMDLENWKNLGFPEDFAKNQIRVMDAFKKMGIVVTSTCTPYLAGNLPRFREHIAWSESSAVSFSNSVIGARTNREGGPSALAAAICGRTPNYGLHLWENRQPTVRIDVDVELSFNSDFGALGYFVGKQVKNKIPYFTGIKNANTDQLKALGAAMAASGAVALYHVENLTPESDLVEKNGLEAISVSSKEIDETIDSLNSGKNPDIVILGCPHASIREISTLAGKTGKSYTYSAHTIDPDGDQVFYWFDWDDGTTSGWKGPYNSGQTESVSHVWNAKGTYQVKVKSKDINGVESVWSNPLPISMPNYKAMDLLFLRFLERHPHIFPILRRILEI